MHARLPVIALAVFFSFTAPCFADASEAGLNQAVRTFQHQYIRFFDLSSDGTKFAYIRSKGRFSGPSDMADIWVKFVSTGELIRIPGVVSRDLDQPRWSPDGKNLAYTAQDPDGRKVLAVWNSQTRRNQLFYEREPTNNGGVGVFDCWLQWSSDSRKLYFLAMRPDTKIQRINRKDPQSSYQSFMDLVGHILYRDHQSGGITELETSSGSASGRATSSIYPEDKIQTRTDVAELSIETGKIRRVFTGSAIKNFQVSPDGNKLLVVSHADIINENVAQVIMRYYVVPISKNVENPTEISSNEASAVDGNGKGVEPIVERAKTMLTPVQSWSPGSDRIAWAEQGGGSDGDVILLDVNTGSVRNLTSSLKLPLDARDLGSDPISMRRSFDFRGKFGNDVVWSADGQTIFARRMVPVPQATNAYGMRGELWSMSAATGRARKLISDSRLSVEGVLNSRGTAWSGAGRIVRPLLVARHITDNASGFARFDPTTGATQPVVRFRGKAARRGADTNYLLSVAAIGERVLFSNERSDAPPELQLLDVTTGKVRQVTDVNSSWAAREMPVVKKVTFTAANGERSGGLLYLPFGSSEKGPVKPPVLLYIYPEDIARNGVAEENYPGAEMLGTALMGAVMKPLLGAGYAILKPDIPFRGEGHACDEITSNTVSALDAAGATGLVDASKAGVLGISFGGYATNCVVTHSGRFKAAVSMAGISNLYDYDLAGISTGGRQAKLGGSSDEPENRELIDRYINDSPLFRAGKIKTPLLLLHGKADSVILFTQSLAMFRAMQRVRSATPVKLVGYDDTGHGVDTHPDAPKQILSWFDTYVKGVPSPAVSTPPKH